MIELANYMQPRVHIKRQKDNILQLQTWWFWVLATPQE